jgi:trk system potassium uptake protein TrkH
MARPKGKSSRNAEDSVSPSSPDDLADSDLYLAKITLSSPKSLAPRPPYARPQRLTEKPVAPSHLYERSDERFRLEAPQVLILGFALIILIGTLLLKLPQASATGEPIGWVEALFTATSATTVTGLVVLNTATDFSFFGQVIILILLQVGGVGFISFSVLLFRLIGRRVTLNERFIVQQTLGASAASGVVGLALFVLVVTLTLEAIGALFLWLRWRTALPDIEAFWYALFHAISSYCNAGFDLFSGTEHGVLFGFGTDSYTLLVMGGLILLGSFGIAVLYDLGSYYKDRSLSLNTRLTLLIALVLTVVGTGMMLLDRRLYNEVMSQATFGEQFAVSLFTIVSARTAGLTIVPLESLSQSTQLIVMLWMFIGGAPASMAGGVSTGTAGVLLIAVIATARGRNAAVGFGRTIPGETIAKAVAIMTVSTLLVTVMTLALSFLRQGDIFLEGFEVVSAFANAGYSLAFTSNLDTVGRLLIAFTMFWGRLGPLTIVVALAESEQPALVGYPEEPIILG